MILIRRIILPAIILSFALFGEPSGTGFSGPRFFGMKFSYLGFPCLGLPELGISQCMAGDWPQILGPNRDSRAVDEEPLRSDWEKDQPKAIWSQPIGSGYAGAAIANGIVYVADRVANQERLQAFELSTGQVKWQATWPATYRSSMDPDSGPRAVPAIEQGKAVCYGAAGDLVCVDTSSGKVLWNQPLRKQFKADDGYFGAGCSPIIVADKVIVNVGGKEAGIVGVSLSTGQVAWKATNYDASYASPIEVAVGDKAAAIVVTRLKTVLIDAASGDVLSEVNFGARGPTVNAATPLRLGNQQFLLTASYNIGAKLLELKGDQLSTVSENKQLLASQYNSPVQVGSLVIGADGREDGGAVALRVLDVSSQSVLQETELPGTTHLIAIGSQLLMLSVDGTLQLANVVDRKLTVMGKHEIASKGPGVFRALPAFSNRVLVVRSSQDGRGGEVTALAIP